MTRSLSPSVGSSAASAGRSMPCIVRSDSFAIAISAPVLPAETAACASPDFTAAIASPIERSEEHTSELQSLMRISYAVFCLKQHKLHTHQHPCSHASPND